MLATWAQQQILNWLFTTESVGTRPTAWFVALHTGAPGTGASNEVDTGDDASYVRKAVTFDTALTGNEWTASSEGAVSFDPAGSGASYTVTHVTVKDASTAGNTLVIVPLAVPIPIVEGGVFSIPLAQLFIEGGV